MLFKSFCLITIVLCIPWLILAEGYDDKITRNRSSLNKLKSEIDNIQRQINKAKKEEVSTNDEIAFIARTRGLLEQERRLLNSKIEGTNRRLEEIHSRIGRLRELYAARAVYAYKHGRVRNIELVLASKSFNEAFIRYKYLKLIAEHDQRMIEG